MQQYSFCFVGAEANAFHLPCYATLWSILPNMVTCPNNCALMLSDASLNEKRYKKWFQNWFLMSCSWVKHNPFGRAWSCCMDPSNFWNSTLQRNFLFQRQSRIFHFFVQVHEAAKTMVDLVPTLCRTLPLPSVLFFLLCNKAKILEYHFSGAIMDKLAPKKVFSNSTSCSHRQVQRTPQSCFNGSV